MDIAEIIAFINNNLSVPLNVLIGQLITAVNNFVLRASDKILFTSTNAAQTNINANVLIPATLTIKIAGTIRTKITINNTTSTSARMIVYKNGVQIWSSIIGTVSSITEFTSDDFSVAVNDVITATVSYRYSIPANCFKIGAEILNAAEADPIIQS